MKNKALSLLLTIIMIILSIAIPVNVYAAETEITAGTTADEATSVSLNTEYFVKVDETFDTHYFTFETENEGFYEIIGTANEAVFAISILSAGEKELGSGNFNYTSSDDTVISKRLDGNEKYLIKVEAGSIYSNPKGRYFFKINYKHDAVADNIENASELNLNQKFDTELEGTDDVDWFMYTNNKGISETVTVSIANNTGSGKWYYFCNESEDKIDIVGYNNYELSKGYTRDVNITLEPNQQLFIMIWFEHKNRYEIGENGYYVLVTSENDSENSQSGNSGSSVIPEVQEPEPDVCTTHERTYSEILDTEYFSYGDGTHAVAENTSIYCRDCDELIEKDLNPDYPDRYEDCSYSNGYCTKCDAKDPDYEEYDDGYYNEEYYGNSSSGNSAENKKEEYLKYVYYADVPENSYAEEEISLIANLGIVAGYADEGTVKFRPDGLMTRAEAARILCALYQEDQNFLAQPHATEFSDVHYDHWASAEIWAMTTAGAIHGYGNGLYGPEDNITGYQLLTLIINGIGNHSDGEAFGGYPYGYYKAAENLGLITGIRSGIDWNHPIKRSDASIIIANTVTKTGIAWYWFDNPVDLWGWE